VLRSSQWPSNGSRLSDITAPKEPRPKVSARRARPGDVDDPPGGPGGAARAGPVVEGRPQSGTFMLRTDLPQQASTLRVMLRSPYRSTDPTTGAASHPVGRAVAGLGHGRPAYP
jgi:hypothetical protein